MSSYTFLGAFPAGADSRGVYVCMWSSIWLSEVVRLLSHVPKSDQTCSKAGTGHRLKASALKSESRFLRILLAVSSEPLPS